MNTSRRKLNFKNSISHFRFERLTSGHWKAPPDSSFVHSWEATVRLKWVLSVNCRQFQEETNYSFVPFVHMPGQISSIAKSFVTYLAFMVFLLIVNCLDMFLQGIVAWKVVVANMTLELVFKVKMDSLHVSLTGCICSKNLLHHVG